LFSKFFINDARFVFKQFYYISSPTIFYNIFVILFSLSVISSLCLIWREYKNSSGIKKIQVRYILFALSIGFGGGSFSFLPVYKIDFYPFLNIFISVGILIVAYAILRYRLMDLRVVARHIFIYIAIATFTYVFFYLIVWFYTKFFGGIFNTASYFTGLIIAPLFVIGFFNFNKLIQHFINKYLFFSLYSYQNTISKLSHELNYLTDLNQIINSIVDTIKQTMQLDRAGVLLINETQKSTYYQIAKVIGFNEKNGISLVQDNFLTQYLKKTQKPMVRDELFLIARDSKTEKDKEGFKNLYNHMEHIEASLCLPLLSSNKLIGIIVLGAKISGDAYTKEDLELLNTLSYQAGIAIDNARLYKEVHDFNKTLKQKVDEQTREIRKKNIHLEELLKMKNEFLNIASHQLKTPISITRGYLSMILDGSLKEPAKKKNAIEKAMFGINRLNNTVKDFLDASDLEGKDMELDFSKVDLVNLINNIVSGKEILAKKKGISLEFKELKKSLPAFNLDGSRLAEAISNLIDNGIFYTEQGGVKISLEVSDNQIKIKIEDTGIGISEDEQKELFTKFKRGKRALLAKPDGSGLGLYIAKKIIELHKGRIFLKSEVGKGTSFIINIPTNLKINQNSLK